MTKLQKKALTYLRKYPERWHTYASDPITRKVIASLEIRMLVTTNKYHQVRAL